MKKEVKRKIGVVTFQNALNYGALLQTYALQCYLNKNGYLCETINYQCKKISDNYKIISLKPFNIRLLVTSIIKIPIVIKKHYRFNSFIKKNVIFSSKKYDIHNVIEANEIYDCFITGSDQVWNLNITRK